MECLKIAAQYYGPWFIIGLVGIIIARTNRRAHRMCDDGAMQRPAAPATLNSTDGPPPPYTNHLIRRRPSIGLAIVVCLLLRELRGYCGVLSNKCNYFILATAKASQCFVTKFQWRNNCPTNKRTGWGRRTVVGNPTTRTSGTS